MDIPSHPPTNTPNHTHRPPHRRIAPHGPPIQYQRRRELASGRQRGEEGEAGDGGVVEELEEEDLRQDPEGGVA